LRDRGFRGTLYLTGLPGWARYGYPVYGFVDLPVADGKEVLTKQAELLENQLQQVKKRLKSPKKNSRAGQIKASFQ